MKPTILENLSLTVDKKKILKRLGFRYGKSTLTPAMECLIEEEINRFYNIFKPKALYLNLDIECSNSKKINIKNTEVFFTSAALVKHLYECRTASLFACTIGKKTDEETKGSFENNEPARGVTLDAIGSVAVEALAEQINDIIHQKAYMEGYTGGTKRFSPGYRDWELEEQDNIFKLILPSAIGITISDSYIMQPEKSITGIIGWKSSKMVKK